MTLQRASFEVMGTVATLVTADSDLADMFATVRQVLGAADRRFSPYRSSSELTGLQRDPATAVGMSSQMQQVLQGCLDLEQRTDGAFRPYDRSGRVETTGYVKGWAMGQVESALRARGWNSWMLSVGGDVVVAGSNGERSWHVAVQHPALNGGVAEVLAIRDSAVATSGDYERGNHIWGRRDAVRGGSVTVVGPRIEIADALATALWADGDENPAWLARFPGYGVLRLDAGGARRAA